MRPSLFVTWVILFLKIPPGGDLTSGSFEFLPSITDHLYIPAVTVLRYSTVSTVLQCKTINIVTYSSKKHQ